MQVHKIDEIVSVTPPPPQLPVPALRLQAFATQRGEAFASRFSSRETVLGELIFLG